MDLLRSWGVEPEVREAGFASLPVMSLRPNLVGPELNRIPFEEHMWTCAQDRLEPILCRRTRSVGTPVAYGWEVTGVQAGDDAVRVTLADRSSHGAAHEVRTRFLVGADGASSVVRPCATTPVIHPAWSTVSPTPIPSACLCPPMPSTSGSAVFPGIPRQGNAWSSTILPPARQLSAPRSAYHPACDHPGGESLRHGGRAGGPLSVGPGALGRRCGTHLPTHHGDGPQRRATRWRVPRPLLGSSAQAWQRP
jgi:hypothetical protein